MLAAVGVMSTVEICCENSKEKSLNAEFHKHFKAFIVEIKTRGIYRDSRSCGFWCLSSSMLGRNGPPLSFDDRPLQNKGQVTS